MGPTCLDANGGSSCQWGAMRAVREAGPRPEAQPPPRLVGTPSEEAELLDLFERQRTPPSALPDPSASVFAIAQGSSTCWEGTVR